MAICASMMLAVVVYLDHHFPNDGRKIVQDWLKAFYTRIDGEEETEH